ncbi:MAG: hypothetical protein H7Y60_06180 [Rhodospirillaceae bacterium]|nr:hypothetical protein [Rhodospirillales bacterium]
MSAIAGLLHLDRGTTEAEPAERMAAGRAWRGADDDGSYRSPDGRAALAAHRLANLDNSAAASQPMANETHDVWLVLDGEILNHRALRHSLELVGHRFRSNSDAEVVLHAYEQWDLAFLDHLQGAFALGLWDDRRDRLVLARDRLGRKPLFVAQHRGRLGFASGIGPLLDEMGLPRRLDPAGLAQYLTLGVVPAPGTLVAGIAKLAPGEMLIADRMGLPRRQLWHNPAMDERHVAALRSLHVDRHVGNLRTLLECAVADRLLGDGPVGVWLTPSPGSGAIAAIINRLTGSAPHAVAVMDTAESVAAIEMRQMARVARIQLDEIIVGPHQVSEALTVMADRLAEPVAHSGLVPVWFAAQSAGAARVAALLADAGTEEVLLCHPAYECGRRAGWLHRLSGVLPRRLRPRTTASVPVPPPALRPFVDRDGSSLLSVSLPVVDAPHPVVPSWMRDDALAILGLSDLTIRMADGITPGLDAMAQAHGLEARLPMLDDSLVTYAQAIPGPLRSPAGAPRQMLRRVLGDLVPAATMARGRPIPCLPLDHWLAGPLAARLEDIAWPLLKTQPMRQLLADHRATLAHGEALWAMLLLAEWCKALRLNELTETEPPQAEMAHQPLN